MSATIDVIVDRHDDFATVRGMHRLAAAHATVLVVTIAPDQRTAPAVVWAILRALGKRTDRLGSRTPTWPDAKRWLVANCIRELVVLRAQHLTDETFDALRTLADGDDLHLTLVVNDGRHDAARLLGSEITTAEAVFDRSRRVARPANATPRWPAVPRSHALRLRFDCLRALEPAPFQRVDQLLNATCRSAEAWFSAHARPTQPAIERALGVLTAASNPDQAHIRRCATQIASWRFGLADPEPISTMPPTKSLKVDGIRDVRAHTDAVTGARRLAELLTGLEPELLDLVGGDQLTEAGVLGDEIPESTRPAARTLGQPHGPVLRRPRPARRRQSSATPEAGQRARRTDAFPLIVGHLLEGRANCVNTDEIPDRALTALEDLVAQRILEIRRGVLRASHVALYSTFGSRWTPSLSTDIQMSRATDTA